MVSTVAPQREGPGSSCWSLQCGVGVFALVSPKPSEVLSSFSCHGLDQGTNYLLNTTRLSVKKKKKKKSWCISHKHAMWQEEKSQNSCWHSSHTWLHERRICLATLLTTASVTTELYQHPRHADQELIITSLTPLVSTPRPLFRVIRCFCYFDHTLHPRTQKMEFKVCVYLSKNHKQRQKESL